MKVSFLSENSTQFSQKVIRTLKVMADKLVVCEFPSMEDIREAAEASDLIVWDWCREGLKTLSTLEKRCPIIAMGKAGDIIPRLEYACIRARCRFHGTPMSLDMCRTYRTIPAILWGRVDLLLFESPHLLDEFEGLFPHIECPKEVVLHRDFSYEAKTEFPTVAALVCRMSVEKDIDFAFRVFRELPEWELIVQGPMDSEVSEWMDQQYYKHLKETAPENVRFAAWGEPWDTYRNASVILSTSVSEGIASSVMEGMAMGCHPVLRGWPGAERCYPYADVVASPEEMAAVLKHWEGKSLCERMMMSNISMRAIRSDPHKGGEDPNRLGALIKAVMEGTNGWPPE